MHVSINVKSPNNISEWQMRFNSAFKGLKKGYSYTSTPSLGLRGLLQGDLYLYLYSLFFVCSSIS